MTHGRAKPDGLVFSKSPRLRSARCCHEVVFPVMPGASANGCFVRGLWFFGLFERVYSSVEVTGTETELKGSKTISLEGERERAMFSL